MRLLVVSQTPHYRDGETLKGWGPTVREMDHLAEHFGEVVHVAPVHDGEAAPPSALAYASPRVRLVPVPRSGGRGVRAKLGILGSLPAYAAAILREARGADVLHVRCPANVGLLGSVMMAGLRRPSRRWIKYAGNWSPGGREPLSYTFQRWWLARGPHRARVTVNGRWPGQPGHVRSFLNPCLTDEEAREGAAASAAKRWGRPVRLLYVGRLESEKGVGRTLRVLAGLVRSGVDAELALVGDGPERPAFEALAGELGVAERVAFHGWLPRTRLAPLYAAAHLFVMPTTASEGWPKVLSEAMAYGVVPLASPVSCIPQFLEDFGTGAVIPAEDVDGYVAAVRAFDADPATWEAAAARAREAASRFTYSNFLRAVGELLEV